MTDNTFQGTTWENNSSAQKIIRGWIRGFEKHASERLQDKIEFATGLVGDHLDRDFGNEPPPKHEPVAYDLEDMENDPY